MPNTSPEYEAFRALCADVITALRQHISVSISMVGDQRASVEGQMTDGRSLSVVIAIDGNTLKASDDTGPWWDWTPTP